MVAASYLCSHHYESCDTETRRMGVDVERRSDTAPVLFCSLGRSTIRSTFQGLTDREAITLVPWEPFSEWKDAKWKRRGPEYEDFEGRLTESLLGQYRDLYPGLAAHLEHAELSTPVSTHHSTSAPAGSIYGLATEPDSFEDETLLPGTSISGLYLSGADVSTPGVAGALMGGLLAAVASTPVVGARYLRGLMGR